MECEIALRIWRRLLESSLEDLRADLIDTAIRYAEMRVRWYMADHEHRAGMNAERTRAHNVFIDTCNILARNMAAGGEDASWREVLGEDRKEIGDFACFVHCFFGVGGAVMEAPCMGWEFAETHERAVEAHSCERGLKARG